MMDNCEEEDACWSVEEGFINAHDPKYAKPFDIPLKVADEHSFAPFGRIVRDYESEEVWIEPWPISGRRPLCPGTGVNAGIKKGDFRLKWDGDLMRATNVAAGDVGEGFVTGRLPPGVAPDKRSHVLVRDINYHPDGGQVFFPQTRDPFVAVLAPADGDDVTPADVVAFYFDGTLGFQIKTGIWHQSPYPVHDEMIFTNKQNATYACVMVDFVREFGQYIRVPLLKDLAE